MRNDGKRDIITLPHPVSKKHPQMSRLNRAAQFAPFAALTGFDDQVAESARLTYRRAELDPDRISELNDRLYFIMNFGEDAPVSITYFRPDPKKEGGAYITKTGVIKLFDVIKRELIMKDKTAIPIDQLFGIDSPVLKNGFLPKDTDT